jgi:hypothetical protein
VGGDHLVGVADGRFNMSRVDRGKRAAGRKRDGLYNSEESSGDLSLCCLLDVMCVVSNLFDA